MSIKSAYEKFASTQGYVHDAAQERVVLALAELQKQLQQQPSGNALSRLLGISSRKHYPGGVYLWGDVGRGKTFLMDLFFSTLDVRKKRRVHFHRMMRDVHCRLKSLQDIEDPLVQVAQDIALESRVLCFDEFFVTDIGDAMILARLLSGLFENGVALVATSNTQPRDLYRNGLQRDRFVPAIKLLEKHLDIIEIDSGTDYRLELLQQAGTYLTPLGADTDRKLRHYFDEIASGDAETGQALLVLGREIATVRSAKGIAWFDFEAICDGPRSQEDYIEIARWYPTVIISGIPRLQRQHDNQARRFIALIDEFYDRKVKVIISAATDINQLYTGDRLSFEFQRTASRLGEMQSAEYLHAEHLA